MIKKIASIKNVAVFTDFQWDSSVLDGNGDVREGKVLGLHNGSHMSDCWLTIVCILARRGIVNRQ